MNLLRQGLTSLRRAPTLWMGLVLTLGLALAAAIVVFMLVNTYLFKPLPIGDSSRLTLVYEYSLQAGRQQQNRLSFGDAADIQAQIASFSRCGIIQNGSFTVYCPDATEVAYVQRVTPEILPMIGARAQLGAIISASNAEMAGQRALLLSDSLWRRRFGANPAVIGKSVQLDKSSYTVVGVMPPQFNTPIPEDLPEAWVAMLPVDFQRDERVRPRHFLIGELALGRSPQAAQQELDRLAAGLRRDFPGTNVDRGFMLLSLRDSLLRNFGRQLMLLQCAVLLVLMVAALNCMCLLLARAIQRRREFAIRLALGAGRTALLRQLFAEALWISLPAAVLGCAIATLAAPLTVELLPPGSLRALPAPHLDLTTCAVAFAAALTLAFALSIPPVLQTRDINLEATLRDGGRQLGSVAGSKATRWLATGQIAIAFALLVGAALLVRSFKALETADYGFPLAAIDQFRVGVRGKYPGDSERLAQLFDEVMRNVTKIPGVKDAAINNYPFAEPPYGYQRFVVEGEDVRLLESPKRVAPHFVSPSLMTTLDLRLIEGRWISEHDRTGKPTVAVVSASFARRYWGQQNPLGARFVVEGPWSEWVTIVGVVADSLGSGNQPAPVDACFIPIAQRCPAALGMSVLLRFSGSAPGERALQDALWAVDPDMQFFQHISAADYYARSAWQTRFVLTLVGIFSGLAVLLSLVGVHAVLSFLVTLRSSEFGVRIALGATRADVTFVVLRDAVRMTGIGVLVGLGLSWLAARSLSGLLFNVPALDLFSYVATTLLICAACLAAALVPAWRATRVSPLVALRS